MITKDTYRFFKSVIPPHVCEDIIKFGLSSNIKTGMTGNYNQTNLSQNDLVDIQKVRKSSIAWLGGEWIYKWIRPYVNEVNKDWKFDINSIDNFQFTIYKENEFYDWHADYFPKKDNPRDRKISLSLSLSDPKDYEGGDLEFIVEDIPKKRHSVICNELLNRGSLVIFPSFVIHKVNPITSGTRYSLVIWHEGPKWK